MLQQNGRRILLHAVYKKLDGSGARVMGKGMSRYKFFWQGCKDGNAGVGLLIAVTGGLIGLLM